MTYLLNNNATWYRNGNVSVTTGSTAVVGVGTSWMSQAKQGDAFGLLVDGAVERMYQIQSVTDNTHIVLTAPITETSQSEAAYAIIRNFSSAWSSKVAELASQQADLAQLWADALQNDFKGSDAPALQIRFSTDGTSWHSTYVSGDAYIGFSTDGGVSWSSAVHFKGDAGSPGTPGDDGDNAPQVQIQYSSDGSSWHSTYVSGDQYIHFSVDNGTTWGSSVLFKGPKGDPGTPGDNAPQVQIQYSSDGSSWHSTYVSGDQYIHFSVDNGTTWGAAAQFSGTTDDKTVKASSTDTTPGFLDAKVDGTTIEVANDKLAVKSSFLATTSAAGLMSAADKAKLDGVDAAQLTEGDAVALIIALS